jgi:hypothetical protein
VGGAGLWVWFLMMLRYLANEMHLIKLKIKLKSAVCERQSIKTYRNLQIQGNPMNSVTNQLSDIFGGNSGNGLEGYIKSLSPEAIAQLSRPESDVVQLMERSIVSSLGMLPGQHFDVTVTTNRDSLAQLLASAMIHGYFLHNAQQRMTLEHSLPNISSEPATSES